MDLLGDLNKILRPSLMEVILDRLDHHGDLRGNANDQNLLAPDAPSPIHLRLLGQSRFKPWGGRHSSVVSSAPTILRPPV